MNDENFEKTLKTKISVYRTESTHDCETCGSSWEEGYHTIFNGEIIGQHAVALCFGAENTTYETVLEEILKRLGYEVEIIDLALYED